MRTFLALLTGFLLLTQSCAVQARFEQEAPFRVRKAELKRTLPGREESPIRTEVILELDQVDDPYLEFNRLHMAHGSYPLRLVSAESNRIVLSANIGGVKTTPTDPAEGQGPAGKEVVPVPAENRAYISYMKGRRLRYAELDSLPRKHTIEIQQ